VQAHLAGRTPDDLKHLAQRLVAHGHTVALLATGQERGEKGYFAFARSEDVEAHMGTLVRRACELAGGRGGGRPAFAQGGAPQADRVGQTLAAVAQTLVDQLASRDVE
jgi:alanyl-tRNA synthetase